ncbi:MAG TPA: peptide chain release factor N(5)-glutamine methyltransferase [Candidatus Lachnoclostridium pullistercoris]|uniref:Release factor glutamine methyltransferase n=1 Tax=Candidatus Lachnoclostridium pullistercoris TaxID=2838632 RepID=A0A9D2T6E3_9FIRM|nr:peptide chain release factor N(5)-glutamine methyltransferase [Candidatus Lachnoclostridium pullistercoris]
MTFFELWKWGESRLADAGIREADLDAKYLLLEAFEMDLAHFLLKEQEQVPSTDGRTREYSDAVSARASRVPLQYLTGKQDFMGLTFCVDERVLIPRQDTETLAELVLKENREKEISLLDLCTGSGCLAVSLAVLGGYEDVDAGDISPDALEVAKENSRRLGAKVRFYEGDLFAALDGEKAYDVIVSNPPYIPTEVIEGLEPEVRDYEPRMALDGDEDGLAFYRRLAEESPAHLKPGGRLYLEIGWDQGEAVEELLRDNGFEKTEVVKDDAGNCRVVRGEKPAAGILAGG